MKEPSRSRRDALTIGLLMVFVAALFADLLFLGNGLFLRDLTLYHYPMKWIVRQGMLSEVVPHWNPYLSAGEPLAANPAYEVFYPPQWLVLLPDYHLGFQLHIILHVGLCLAGLFLLLRSLGLGLTASVLGSISFALGGAVFSLVNVLPTLFAFTWIPWILLYARLFLISRKLRHLALGSVFVGLHLIVGEPASMLQAAILVAALVAWRTVRLRKRRMRRLVHTLIALGVMGLGGIAISAVQLIPALDFFQDTIRAQGFERSISSLWSMPLIRPIELLFPSVFGSMQDAGAIFWGARLYPDRALPYLYSVYIGFGVTVLALAGLLARVRGTALAFILMALSYVLAIGNNGPFFESLYSLGLFRTVRYPERFAILGLFALAVFGATVLDRLLRRDRKVLRIALAVSWTVSAVGILIWAITLSAAHDRWFASQWSLLPGPLLEAFLSVNQREWMLAVLRAIAFSALLTWSLFRRDRIWAGAFLLFLLVDMAPLSWRLLPRMPERFFHEPDLSTRLPEPRDSYRVFFLSQWMEKTEEARQYMEPGATSAQVMRNGLFPNSGARWGVRSVLEHNIDSTMLSTTEALHGSLVEATGRMPNQYLARYAAISNVHFFTRYRPLAVALREARGDVEKVQPLTFVGGERNPRHYFADRVQTIRDQSEFTEGIISPAFTARTALVFFPSFEPAAGSVLSAAEKGNQIRVSVNTAGKSFLVNSVSFHRYWKATLDGRPVPVDRANLAYLGVVVPEGRHEVVLTYQNPWILPAGAVSLFAAMASLAAVRSTRSLRRR